MPYLADKTSKRKYNRKNKIDKKKIRKKNINRNDDIRGYYEREKYASNRNRKKDQD